MKTETFNKFFESSESYHSFTDLLNLAKEVADYIYNKDIIKSGKFVNFSETEKGYELIFDKTEKDDIFIDAVKKKIQNEKDDDITIDQAYSEIEDLYRDIKLEFYVNIKQIDEDIKTFNELIPMNEGFYDDLEQKLSEKYKNLKKGILDLMDTTLKGNVIEIQKFIDDFVKPDSEEILDNFVENAEIFDFYLKYQTDIDELLNDEGYFDQTPEVESLYDYLVDGTFDSVVLCMKQLKEELFGTA